MLKDSKQWLLACHYFSDEMSPIVGRFLRLAVFSMGDFKNLCSVDSESRTCFFNVE